MQAAPVTASPSGQSSLPQSSGSANTVQVSRTSQSTAGTTASAKVKRTRRRQRLSCVECALKRTKCDRQIPCSTCISRGVAQLCRWEPIVSRSRATHAPPQPEGTPSGSTIAALSSRIAVLEQALLTQNIARTDTATGGEAHCPPSGSLAAPNRSPSSDTSAPPKQEGVPEPKTAIAPFVRDSSAESDGQDSSAPESGDCVLSLFDYEVQLAAISLAHLSLAPKDEYIGGGTVLCALHKLGDPYRYRYPFARSADSTTVNKSYTRPGGHPLSSQIQKLTSSLPSKERTDVLVDAYFAERNWEFCIPERWFRQSCEQMWRHLDLRCPAPHACVASGGCARCTKELNPHWLALLFAVLALAPRRLVGADAKVYFLRAMEARRLIEDVLLASRAYSQPSSVNGVVQSCIGAVLLAKYLADRGRVSDAWKLTGSAVRAAQAVGLHRDPGWQKWDNMDTQERELRLVGWWSLVVADRLYSFILGRPMMTMVGTFDVKLVPGATHGDGSPNPHAEYQQCLIALFEIIGETIDKCLGIFAPAYGTTLEIDQKYKIWLSKLPPFLDWRKAHRAPTTPEERSRAYQRHTCAAYYLGALMNLHRPYLMHAPPILPPPHALSATMKVITNPSRERCIATALELVRVGCASQREAAQWGDAQLPAALLQYTYYAFDGAVALMGALSQDPPHPKARECLELIDEATGMLRGCVAVAGGTAGEAEDVDGEADTAARAVSVLEALRGAGRWDERLRGDGNAPLARDNSNYVSAAVGDPPARTSAPQTARSFSEYPRLNLSEATMPPGLDQVRYTAYPSYPSYSSGATHTSPHSYPSTAPGQLPQSFPFSLPGPAHMPPSATMDSMFADVRDFTGAGPGSSGSASGAYPATVQDFAVQAQTMSMPFEMLQQDGGDGGAYGVDWSMFVEMQAWPGHGLFDST